MVFARELLAHLAQAWNVDWVAGIGITINGRLRRAIGRYLVKENRIELSPAAVRSRYRELIVAHEAAHAVVLLRYGRDAQPHGTEWRFLMATAGFPDAGPTLRLEEELRPTNTNPRPFRQPSRNYSHRCTTCGMVRLAACAVRRWRCAACVRAGLAGTLEITRIR